MSKRYRTRVRWVSPCACFAVAVAVAVAAGPVLLFFAAALPAKFVVRGLMLG